MSNANLDALLDMSLDDLADLPEFKVFPAGAHKCTMELTSKEINGTPAIELKLKLIETIELADPSEQAMAEGTESSVAFMLNNELGQGKFKAIAKILAGHFGCSTVAEVIEQSKGAEVLAVTKTRQNKEKTQTYLDVVTLQVL